MKFKYTGQNDTFCLELLAYNIMLKNEYLQNGQVIEVPDNNTTLVGALNASGVFVPVNVTVNKSKKEKKDKDE